MLYDQLFVSMESARWDLSRDIDFEAIEPARLTPRWIDTVREVCALQLASLRASEMFLGGFRADIDFCSFVSVWFYEEMEHHLVLRKYLEHLGEALEETEMPRLRVSPDEAPAIDALTLRFFGEQRLAQRYAALATTVPERVLGRIFTILAAGEARHAAAYATYLRRAVERHPAALPGTLRLALWTMRAADEPTAATAVGVVAGQSSAPLREDRHYIRRMQGLYRLLAPDATILVEEELPALSPATAGAL